MSRAVQPVQNAPSAPDQTCFDNDIMRGHIHQYAPRQGVELCSLDLRYLQDTVIELDEKPSLFLGMMTSPAAVPLGIEGLGRFNVTCHPLLINFSEIHRCRGEHRAGSHCTSYSLRVNETSLTALGEVYGNAVVAPLLDVVRHGTSVRSLIDAQRLRHIIREAIGNPYIGGLGRMYADGCVLQILAELVAVIRAGVTVRGEAPALKHAEYERVEAVRAMLDATLMAAPSLRDICTAVGSNATTLSNQFRQVHGCTIFAYLRDRRLDKAQTLLREDNLQIAQVGYQVGYNNPAAFATAYRKRFGYSPKHEKKQASSRLKPHN